MKVIYVKGHWQIW